MRQGIADSSNEPPGREQALSWKDTEGNNWLFGGSYFLNDLWKINSSRYDPVMHIVFRGEVAGQNIRLMWETDNETNTDYFILERSPDRVRFDSLVRVEAAGNSSTTSSYAYLDSHPLPDTSYYRLKVMFTNGNFFYSDSIAVYRSVAGISLLPFPNPAHDFIQVPLTAGQDNAFICVFDAAGKTVIQKIVTNTNGSYYSLNISYLPAGVYFIRIQEQDQIRVQRFLKR